MTQRFICKKAAVFSDIHSNYAAFQACYADTLAQGADLFIFLGDFVSDLADPVKVMDLVYEIRSQYPTVCLRGNRERYLLDCLHEKTSFAPGSKTGSLLYTYHQLRPQDLAFFESLPIYDEITLNGIPFAIAHGCKDDDRFYFAGNDENTDTILNQMQQPYFLGGHCHRQYIRCRGDKTIINPGSIGVPRDHGDLAQYALLDFHGHSPNIQLCRIPYNVSATIHRQFESGLTELAPHWAISILYDVILGREYTMALLERLTPAQMYDEQAWHDMAVQMGMQFTEEEIISFYQQQKSR